MPQLRYNKSTWEAFLNSNIVSEPIEIGNRLQSLGLNREELLEVVYAMVGAKRDCTKNFPPSAPGWLSWCYGTVRLREIKCSTEGWQKDDSDQISSVLNKKLGVKIVVSNTDYATGLGLENTVPQNRSKKGAATERNISSNQLSFMDVLDQSLDVSYLNRKNIFGESITTWFLCVYHEGDVVRAELSCPIKVENGFFTGFSERITIISEKDDNSPVHRRVTEEPDIEFDIPVARK